MPCDRTLKRGQSIALRAQEIKAVVAKVSSALTAGKIKTVIGPTGAVAFTGLSDQDRDDVTDTCIYRRVMATGSALAKAAIAKAEALAGRSVNKQSIAHGHHAHADQHGNLHWHDHK